MRYEMRRKDRELTGKEAEQILKDNHYGILSLICEDGYPYGVPLNYVYMDHKLYFHGSKDPGLKNDSITNNTKACFTVVGKTKLLPDKFSTIYESAIAFGIIRKSEDRMGVLMKLVEGLSADYMDQGRKAAEGDMDKVTVYEMEVNQLTGKARR